MLHYFAIALIVAGIACFFLIPFLGASLFIVGVAIETVGYFVWGAADFWNRQREKEEPAKNERS
jgi:hypothetical protein